jgi:hypothetical protein
MNPRYRYAGLDDPSRALIIEFTHTMIMKRMKLFFSPTIEQPTLFEEYSAANPPHGVSETTEFLFVVVA